MNFIGDLKELNYSLSVIRSVITLKNKGVFEGIQFNAKDGKLFITGSDGVCTITSEMNVTILEEGLVVVPAMFAEILSKQSGYQIQISQEGNTVCVYGDNSGKKKSKSKASISIMTGDSLTEVPEMNEANLRVNSETFFDAINNVQFAIAKEENRVVLTGMYVEIAEDIQLTTLDGFKMSHLSVPGTTNVPDGTKIHGIIPGRACALMSKIAHSGAKDEDFVMSIQSGTAVCACGAFRMRAVLIAGEYVDYNRIVPQESKIDARVKKEDLLQGLSRVYVYTSDSIEKNIVRLNFSESCLTLSAHASFGEVEDEMDADVQGGDILIAFNSQFLTDTVKSVAGDYVCFHMTSSVSTVKITDGESNQIAIILPVRVRSESSVA